MTETKDHSDLKTMSFEQALKIHCDALLRKAEARVEKISLNQNGQPTGTEPLDVEN